MNEVLTAARDLLQRCHAAHLRVAPGTVPGTLDVQNLRHKEGYRPPAALRRELSANKAAILAYLTGCAYCGAELAGNRYLCPRCAPGRTETVKGAG